MSVLMYRCLTNNDPVYLCDHFNAASDVHFYNIRSNVKGNLYVPNTKRETLKQSLLYKGPVIWNDLTSFIESASNLDSFKKLYIRLSRN